MAKAKTTPSDVSKMIKDREVKLVDFKFADLPGTWQHFTTTLTEYNEDIFTEGLGFDGSSIRGWKAINASDMLVIPDPASAWVDIFNAEPTLSLICTIVDPITREPYSRDPRGVAEKAEAYLQSTGIADTAYAGDRQGNLYKFTSLAASAPAVTTMFTTAANQPITAAPFAAKDPVSNTTWVFIGTGQFLNSADINTTATQSWYGIKDTGTAATLANLVQRTFTDTTVTAATTGFLLRTLSTGSATDLSGKDGWYINLPISGERMVLPNRFSSGVLLGTSLIPDTPDACKPTGRGVIMAINPYTGSRLDTTFFDANRDGVFDGGDTAGGTIASGLIDDTAMTQSISVGSNILWQDMQGGISSLRTQGGAAQAGRLSWREITN